MDTLNEIELWLDGLALNDYLRIKVFARAIDMTGSETPPGELEGMRKSIVKISLSTLNLQVQQ
jgi:hypothetical protein